MKSLIAFIESHGFPVTPNTDGTVTFSVPLSLHGTPAGYEAHTVRTYNEARAAMGY